MFLLQMTGGTATLWAYGEPAGDVIEMIESEKAAKSTAAEIARRIAANRRAAAHKQAEEKAAAEEKERERLTAQIAAAERERERVQQAAQKTAEEKKSEPLAEGSKAAEESARLAAIPRKEPLTRNDDAAMAAPSGETVQPAPAIIAAEPSSPEESVPVASPEPVKVGNEPSGKSWLASFTDVVGLTDADPGITTQAVSSTLASGASDYIIGPGDVIGISVWRDENLTRSVVVLPDGKITFPLLGDLVAGGKTVAQLKQELETRLTRYTADSSVTVEIKQSNSMIIYIIGRVNTPGRQVLVANTNVLQALAMAGGMNPFARKSKVKIYRQETGKTAVFAFNYDEIMEGKHLETNIELKRGDVIIVP